MALGSLSPEAANFLSGAVRARLSIVFAGAGTPGGRLIGKTDNEGGYVLDSPHTPEEYASTIYEKLGIDRSKPLYTSANRPVYFDHHAEPIQGVM